MWGEYMPKLPPNMLGSRLHDMPIISNILFIALINIDDSLTSAAMIIAKPKVTSPRNHSLNLTHIIPSSNPTKAAVRAPENTPIIGEIPFVTMIVEAKPPIPRNAA